MARTEHDAPSHPAADRHLSASQAAVRNQDAHPVPDTVAPNDASEMSIAKSAARDELMVLRAQLNEMVTVVNRICARFGMT